LNLGGSLARCGLVGERNYDFPQNYFGNNLEWDSQAVYPAGGATITIEAVLTAHHKGHFVLKACPVSPLETPSQACFDAHPLEFVNDELYGAPKDMNFPERAYIAPPDVAIADTDSNGEQGKLFKYKYKLPSDVSGTVLLQWHYLTANSCLPGEGYLDYPFPASDWNSNVATCSNIPDDGVGGVPEQFWNCAEVCVGTAAECHTVSAVPTPPSPPVTKSPTISPTKSSSASPTVKGEPTTSAPTRQHIPSSSRPPSVPTDKKVVGYYASWQYYDRDGIARPENLDFTKVDRVNFAFFQPDVNGNLFGTDAWIDPIVLFGPIKYNPPAGATSYCSWDGPLQKNCEYHQYERGLISLVHAAGGEIYPSIGGWTLSDSFPALAASPTARTTFANQCVDLIKGYDFDGIDIDWEFPGYASHSGTSQDKQNFNLLLDDIRMKLDALGSQTGKYYGLTAALPCGPDHIANMDIPHVASVLDELLLMTYDFHGAWDPQTGVNSPLSYQGFGDMDFNVDSCVKNWKNGGAPASKISIGLAFYGRSFAYATGLNQPHQGADLNNWSVDDGLPQYFNIVDRLSTMTSIRHDASKTQYAFFNSGSGFISYDDERSICEKTEYVIDNNLKGFLIWELTGDLMLDFSTPLLDAVNDKLAEPSSICTGGPPFTQAPSPMITGDPTNFPTKVIGSPSSTIFPTTGTSAPSPSPTKGDTAGPNLSKPSLCPSGYSGLQASFNCEKYFHCRNGEVISYLISCPVGTLFDNSTQQCNYDYNVTCGPPTPGPPTSTPTVTVTSHPTKVVTHTPSLSVVSPSCSTGFTGLKASSNCEHYFHCDAGNIIDVLLPCPPNTLFDEAKGYCNHNYLVHCGSGPPPAPTCEAGKLAAVESCSGYQHCGSNGQLSGNTQYCGAGTLFDENNQICNHAYAVNCTGRRLRGGKEAER